MKIEVAYVYVLLIHFRFYQNLILLSIKLGIAFANVKLTPFWGYQRDV